MKHPIKNGDHAPRWMFALALGTALLGMAVLDAPSLAAQARGEVIDPFSGAAASTGSELLDPFTEAPPRRASRTAASIPPSPAPGAHRTTDLLDPFTSAARRVVRYLELLDPWSD